MKKLKCFLAITLVSTAFLLIAPFSATASTVTLSDLELTVLDHQNASRNEVYLTYSEGTVGSISRNDIFGPGVAFTFSSLNGKAQLGDNFELNALVGGTGLHNAYFDVPTPGFDRYEMYITNQSQYTVNAHLFMNTGFITGTHDGLERNWHFDTYWGGPWQEIAPGKAVLLYLTFSSAQAWNIADDPQYTGYIEGDPYPIFRLDEVTNIGFEISGVTGANPLTVVVASAVPIPSSVLLLGAGLIGLVGLRRKREA